METSTTTVTAEPEDIGHEEKVEAAFLNSENHAFNGEKLQPYSPARIFAAQKMGLAYGYVDSEGVAQFKRMGIYPGEPGDVAIVLWLCTLKSDDEIDSAFCDPKSARKKAFQWAKEKGIADDHSKQYREARDLFYQILHEVYDSRFTAEKKSPATDDLAPIPATT